LLWSFATTTAAQADASPRKGNYSAIYPKKIPLRAKTGRGIGIRTMLPVTARYVRTPMLSPGETSPPLMTRAKTPSFGMTQSPAW